MSAAPRTPPPAGAVLQPAPTPYDLTTPREPAQYVVPAEYRRPFGQLPIDKRGKGWFLACASVVAVALSFVAPAFSMGLPGMTLIPPLAALAMGIMALQRYKKSPKTMLASQTKTYAWVGIIGGVFGTLLGIAVTLLIMFFGS